MSIAIAACITDSKKRENSSFRKIVLLNIAATYTTVWLLCNLSLDGNLCLHDEKNAALG